MPVYFPLLVTHMSSYAQKNNDIRLFYLGKKKKLSLIRLAKDSTIL